MVWSSWLRNVDLAASISLHVFDGFSTYVWSVLLYQQLVDDPMLSPLPMIIPTASDGTMIVSFIFSP